ncbi:N-lysine methyltransferase [Rhynchospora pubera]|uniref:N-lysine methyltransferase n=1 Tax=Rhynchospora pubera TaxID=906938 RepID=A0AAV8HN37_9POAL|nr:N-lysine methyltransferase [Rhynchospora pubera]KAJ4764737.1 N-lysine methyltransferase [Rhynchospora pubera]KAJ4793619.1 N-lysine methyltransferase [Rhynchospora pubera]KAJ4817452.1 N-lysine methyltransferase [Rhynchospora pubera]
MDRSTPVRKSHTNTADLLTWQEVPPSESDQTTPLNRKPHQPSEAIRKVVFGGQVTEEEAESLNKRKPCSAPKWKEMTGSGIFAPGSEEALEDEAASVTPVRTASRAYQQTLSGFSQISFSADEDNVSPKKPSSIAEMAKQKELSGTLLSDAEADKMKRQVSDAKRKEISGHDIFAPPEELRPRNVDEGPTTPRGLHSTSAGGASSFLFGEDSDSNVKTAKKIPTRKFSDLTGNDIFKGDTTPGTAEKSLSNAKLKEMTGSDIFADGKAASRHYLGGARKPPGGESSIALV